MPACGRPPCTTSRTACSIAATAALLSAPRMPGSALRITPPSITGRIGTSVATVSMCEQNTSASAAVGRWRHAAVEVAAVAADLRAGVVLVDLEAERPQVRGDRVRHAALAAGRARDGCKLAEEIDDAPRGDGRHPTVLAVPAVSPTEPGRKRPCSTAAPTKSRNSGWGRVGRDVNSGWNWLATNQG